MDFSLTSLAAKRAHARASKSALSLCTRESAMNASAAIEGSG